MKTRIMSLGEIVTPDIMKAIRGFTALVASKKTDVNPADLGKAIGGVLQLNMALVNDFKLGKVDEADFTNRMIEAIEAATAVKLSITEFDNAWIQMCPAYSQFETALKQAIAFNSEAGQKLILISGTNPKDVRQLIQQLQANHVECRVEHNELIEIGGITLYATYTAKKSKAELLEFVIKSLSTQPAAQSSLATSISSILQAAQPAQQMDIKYIRGQNEVKEPTVKADTDKTNDAIEEQAAALFVNSIVWNKQEQSLTDVLSNAQADSQRMLVSKF